MYILGAPTTVTIDDMLPLSSSGTSIFAKASSDGALWGPLLEKAFAKLHGTYEAIISGDPRHSIEVLTGAPATRYTHSSYTANQLWDEIEEALNADGMVSALTPGTSDSSTSSLGIV
jgi:calpain